MFTCWLKSGVFGGRLKIQCVIPFLSQLLRYTKHVFRCDDTPVLWTHWSCWRVISLEKQRMWYVTIESGTQLSSVCCYLDTHRLLSDIISSRFSSFIWLLHKKQNSLHLPEGPDSCVSQNASLWLTFSLLGGGGSGGVWLPHFLIHAGFHSSALLILLSKTSRGATEAFLKRLLYSLMPAATCKHSFICKALVILTPTNCSACWRDGKHPFKCERVQADYFQSAHFVPALPGASRPTPGHGESGGKQHHAIHHLEKQEELPPVVMHCGKPHPWGSGCLLCNWCGSWCGPFLFFCWYYLMCFKVMFIFSDIININCQKNEET